MSIREGLDYRGRRADNLHNVFMGHLRGRSVRFVVIIRLFYGVDAYYGTGRATFFGSRCSWEIFRAVAI